ncbi:MAG: hypothetical protein MJZ36_03760 [Bacteroidaceae bacterium]|nr:hypothetical protein [Bacteroidaceae bacterium]
MKKVFYLFAAICMMAVTMVSFTSCEKDGDKKKEAPSVEGTWVGKAKTNLGLFGEDAKYVDCTFTFAKNKATITEGDNEPVEYTFTYNAALLDSDPAYLTFFYKGEDVGSLHYKIEGNKLIFTGTNGSWGYGYVGTFTKK